MFNGWQSVCFSSSFMTLVNLNRGRIHVFKKLESRERIEVFSIFYEHLGEETLK